MDIEFELIPGRKIGKNHPCFIIAEIGQNHQGDINIAKRMIIEAKEIGADCVKFQKTDLPSRFNKAALERPYVSLNSWGKTYGEHRKHLEFSEDQFYELYQFAQQKDISFSSSGMDKKSVDFLHKLGIPFFKVGSGDSNNFPQLIHTAKFTKPMVISTGMQNMETVKKVYDLLMPINKRLCFLLCTSSYPAPPKDIHLNVLKTYKSELPGAIIGYSGHEVGQEITIAAVALGAKVVERHLTLNRTWKGSDHVASLEPQEFKQLVRQIRNVELALGTTEKVLRDSEIPCYEKLGKTIVAAKFIPAGTVLTEDMLDVKVAEPKGRRAEELSELIGRTAKHDVSYDHSITDDVVD
ncbi:sialic acid synthase-like isoform X2 [Centruroides sculpturatus]|uniref:sialic acid synthase-like isoform X2 n=1 Tax=Centruroides sculpturatus TaxID=218467 RepID=UPI000C6D9656|nr:sialic acid synthase-like isoform X2 [Centruroides sculpturatus]